MSMSTDFHLRGKEEIVARNIKSRTITLSIENEDYTQEVTLYFEHNSGGYAMALRMRAAVDDLIDKLLTKLDEEDTE